MAMDHTLEEGTEIHLDFEKLRKIAQTDHPVIPVAVQDVDSKAVLLIGYVNEQALEYALEHRVATFWSTSLKIRSPSRWPVRTGKGRTCMERYRLPAPRCPSWRANWPALGPRCGFATRPVPAATASTVSLEPWARMHRGGVLTDPTPAGRPHQDRPARCCVSGEAFPTRRGSAPTEDG